MNNSTTYSTTAGAGAIALIAGWFISHINVYLNAVGWGMSPEVQDAFVGFIVGGGASYLIHKAVADAKTALGGK